MKIQFTGNPDIEKLSLYIIKHYKKYKALYK